MKRQTITFQKESISSKNNKKDPLSLINPLSLNLRQSKSLSKSQRLIKEDRSPKGNLESRMKYFDYLATLEPLPIRHLGQFHEIPPSRHLYATEFKTKHPDYMDIFGAPLPLGSFLPFDPPKPSMKYLDYLAQLEPSLGKKQRSFKNWTKCHHY